jgi:hypothetical protein
VHAGSQNAHVLADDLVPRIAGQGAEAVVHLENAGVRVGDDDALVGVAEHAGGEAQVVLGGNPGGDVVEGAGGADDLASLVELRPDEDVHPAMTAIPALQTQGDAAVGEAAGNDRLEGTVFMRTVIRMEEITEVAPKGFLDRVAADVGPGGVEELPVAERIGLEDHLADIVEDLLVTGLALLEGLGGLPGKRDVGDAADHAQGLAVLVQFHHVTPVTHPQVVSVGMADAVLAAVGATAAQTGVGHPGDPRPIVRMHQRQHERRGVRHVAFIKPEQFAPARIVGNPVGEQIPVPHALADGGQDIGELGLVVVGGRLLAHALADVAGEPERTDDAAVTAAHRCLVGFEPGGRALVIDLLDHGAGATAVHHFNILGAIEFRLLPRPQIQVRLPEHSLGRDLPAGFCEGLIDYQETPLAILQP